LQVPDVAVDPSDVTGHTRIVTDFIKEALESAAGVGEGTLVLFASRRQMEDVYFDLPASLRERILMQGEWSKQEMLSRHRERIDAAVDSVLFGLASFTEGVDLPGNYCTHVVIAKLPFAVPDDPVEEAQAEWVEAQGGNAFLQMAVPDAALRLVQACGRLLRNETDHGKITVLDRRLLTRRYGQLILDTLPPYARAFDSRGKAVRERMG